MEEDPLLRFWKSKKKLIEIISLIFLILFLLGWHEANIKANDVLQKELNFVPIGIDENKEKEKCDHSSLWCQKWQEEENNNEYSYESLLEGYPISEMIPFLKEKDFKIAAFLVAIAKKESNWGKHSPQKNGRTCYNYWGYRGSYNKTSSGYSCFDSPSQAVQVVGERVEDLIQKGIDTPEEMLVWKCGSSCASHNPKGVAKWVSDVKSVLLAMNF